MRTFLSAVVLASAVIYAAAIFVLTSPTSGAGSSLSNVTVRAKSPPRTAAATGEDLARRTTTVAIRRTPSEPSADQHIQVARADKPATENAEPQAKPTEEAVDLPEDTEEDAAWDADPAWGQIKYAAAYMRNGPSIDAELVSIIPFGNKVHMLATRADWIEIRNPESGKRGWVYAKYVAPSAPPKAEKQVASKEEQQDASEGAASEAAVKPSKPQTSAKKPSRESRSARRAAPRNPSKPPAVASVEERPVQRRGPRFAYEGRPDWRAPSFNARRERRGLFGFGAPPPNGTVLPF